MAHLLAALEALRDRINTVWPECASSGILHVMQAARRTLDSRVEANDLPFCAFDWQPGGAPDAQPFDAGVDGDSVVVNYVAKDTVDLSEVIAKVEALRDSLWADRDLGAGGAQVGVYPVVDFGTGLFLNRYFISTLRPYISGACIVRIDSGEIPDAYEAAQYFAGLGASLRYELGRGVQDGLDALVAAAEKRSSGPLTPDDLRRLGHPYSRRRSPSRDPDVINRQTGGIAGSWEARGPVVSGDTVSGSVYNTDPKAASLEAGLVNGRPLMWPRQPHRGALKDTEAQILARLEQALDDALEP